MAQRQHMLRVRISDEEKEHLQQLAQETGLTLSALVRDHVGKLTVNHREDAHLMRVSLNRINANLNMVAKWVNTYKDQFDVVEVLSHLLAVERDIDAHLMRVK